MIPLWPAVALGAPPAQVQEADYRDDLDQARFFVKKGWLADAEEHLERASRHPDGRLDPEVWYLLARVRYERADLVGARQAADQALTRARTPEEEASTRAWLDYLDQRFGFVELLPPRPGLAGRVDLRLGDRILDPELRSWFDRAVERLAEPVDLPLVLGLPAGTTYLLNGVEVTVRPAETTRVPIDVSRVLAQRIELQLGAGLTGWLGPDAAPLTPSPVLQLGAVLPLGPALVGLHGGPVLVGWEDRAGDLRARPSWMAEGRVGVDAGAGRAIGLRAGAGLALGGLDGLRPGCAVPRGCSSVATSPGLWVALPWRDPSRATGPGAGLRLVGERASGRVEGTRWAAWGLRLVVDGSWSL